MSQFDVRTFDVTLGKVYKLDAQGNILEECENPIVELAGKQDVAIACIDPDCGLYRVQIGPEDIDPCLTFIVQCEDCDICPPVIIEKCFCETQEDCKDCEICVDGFCVPLCPEEECVDGVCVDCVTEEDCPCNQICVNGKCECPPNTTLDPETGCCNVGNCPPDPCVTDNDCPTGCVCPEDKCVGECGICEVHVFQNGAWVCVPKDCGDFIPNFTDPECPCVECIGSGDCSKDNECCVNNTCVCCPGFRRDPNTGECSPDVCITDEDCGPCEICNTLENRCELIQCLPGEALHLVPGVDKCCWEECECADPDCTFARDYCTETYFDPATCVCVPCEGTCDQGCEAPCICNPITNECEFNPCAGPCTTGVDCDDPNCGCLNGECVPCYILDCVSSDECEKALGCECSYSDVCEPAKGCPPTPCSTHNDCPRGCTCYQGICVSCDNFSCDNTDCENQPGCVCVGNECEGAEEECLDVVTLEKDDEECTLTGTLIKQECCQCPALTIAAKGQIASETTDSYTFNFIAELRKGAYDGVSIDSNPRLDESVKTSPYYTNNPIVAENEPPTKGKISLIYSVTYDVFNIVNGVPVYAGKTSVNGPLEQRDFIETGLSAEVKFNGITIPKIDSREDLGSQIRYAKKVTIKFTQTSTLVFPNDCDYAGGVVFAVYNIQRNSEFQAFGTGSSHTNGKADTIKSDDCRKPFFRWYKSNEPSINTDPFRKIYVAASGTNTYVDILTDYEEDGLESCKYYLFDPDCNCTDDATMYVVFCNPEDITYELDNCNTQFKLLAPFEPCDPNKELPVTYRIQAGSINRTFTAEDAEGVADGEPIFTETSTTEITEIVYSITCDVEGVCTKTYEVDPFENQLDISTTCINNGTEIEVTFTSTECGINNISVDVPGEGTRVLNVNGQTLYTTKFDTGSYTGVVNWACGCDPTEISFSEDCCGFFSLKPCSRNCDTGEPSNGSCEEVEGVTYYSCTDATCDNATELTVSLAEYISAQPINEPIYYKGQKGDCNPVVATISPAEEGCCDDFSINYVEDPNRATKGILTVYNATGVVDVNISPLGPNITEIIGSGCSMGLCFEITGLEEGTPYTITVTDPTCPPESIGIVPGQCVVNLEAHADWYECDIVATVNPQECKCPKPSFVASVDSVSLKEGSNIYEVTWSTDFVPIDAEYTSGRATITYKTKFGTDVTETMDLLEMSEEKTSVFTAYVPGSPSANCLQHSFSYKLISVVPEPLESPTRLQVILGTSEANAIKVGDSLNVKVGGVTKSIEVGSMLVVINGQTALLEEPEGGVYVSVPTQVITLGSDNTVRWYITSTEGEQFDSEDVVFTNIQSSASFTSVAANLCLIGGTGTQPLPVDFIIGHTEIKTEDNCSYEKGSHKFVIQKDFKDSKVLPLEWAKDTEYDRHVKFTWNRYDLTGTTIDSTFVDFDDTTSEINVDPCEGCPEDFAQQGRKYVIQADCDQCRDTATEMFCCLPVVTVGEITGCNESMTLVLTGGLDGFYQIIYDKQTFEVEVTSGTGTIGPITGFGGGQLRLESVQIQPLGVEACKDRQTIEIGENCANSPSLKVEAGDCSPGLDTFTVTVSGCPGATISSVQGTYGNVANGQEAQTISEVSREDPVTCLVADELGCQVKVGPTHTACVDRWGVGCDKQYLTPCLPVSVTPTVTQTPPLTPPVSGTPGASPTVSSTPDPTISISSTPDPTISVSRSVGAPPPSASVTVSISSTPDPTATPSTTPDPTATPSTTPDPTATPSTTPDPTVTVSSTPDPSITPTVSPSTSKTLENCFGTLYDPLTEQCCPIDGPGS